MPEFKVSFHLSVPMEMTVYGTSKHLAVARFERYPIDFIKKESRKSIDTVGGIFIEKTQVVLVEPLKG